MPRRGTTTPADKRPFMAEMDDWAESWKGTDRDAPPGARLVAEMKPFVVHLQEAGFAPKTVRRHLDNLWLIGGEIVRTFWEEPSRRKRPSHELLLHAVRGGEAPLCQHVDEAGQAQLDATARKLHKFLCAKYGVAGS